MIRRPAYNFQIRTGAEGYYEDAPTQQNPRAKKWVMPEAWDYGMVMRREGTGWVDHAEYSQYSEDGQFTSFIVELIHDTTEANLIVNRACYDGGTPFCVCAHVGGNDKPGIALRRWTQGAGQTQYRKIECDPDQCDLRLLVTTTGKDTDKHLPAAYADLYPDFKNPRPDQPPSCKAQVCFLFRLLLPDGSDYAHGPYDICALTTTSDKTRGLLWNKLQELWVETGGHLAGLRLELRALQWFSTRFKKNFTAWELRTSDEGSVLEQRAAQGHRLMLRKLDPVKVADQGSNALAVITEGGEYNLAQLGMDDAMQAAVDMKKLEMEQEAFAASYIDPASIDFPTDHPFVRRMAERLQLEYCRRVALPLQHGYDHYNVMVALKRDAVERKIPVADIWREYLEYMEIAPSQPKVAVKQQPTSSTVQEAEVSTEVACPTCNKPAWRKPDGTINCPGCNTANDLSKVSGER